MRFLIITDTHFGHKAMHNYCGRPIGFEGQILKNIAQIIRSDDILIHLGDFCIGQDAYWHQHFMAVCHCKRWLIRGNHDRKSNTWYLSQGWHFVGERAEIAAFGHRIVLTHIPIDEPGDFINVHGHLHNTGHHPECMTADKHRLLVIEHEYRPVDLQKFLRL